MRTTASSPLPERLRDAFERHRGALFGVCYRMTGSVADAEEIVQETFLRVLERPPDDVARDLAPWLTRVAINLARDRLRRRRRRGYDGPWLPAPAELPASRDISPPPSARYDRVESVTVAFLLALEALSPTQRATLILRDVLDHGVAEVAGILGMTDSNVKVTHHRARKALEAALSTEREYRGSVPDEVGREAQAAAIQRFLVALVSGDFDTARECLAEDVRVCSDGGGEYFASRVVIVGRERALTFLSRIARDTTLVRHELLDLNGARVLVAQLGPRADRYAERVVTHVELDAEGRIRAYDTILATRKIEHLFADEESGALDSSGRV